MAREYWKAEITRTEAGGEPVDPQRQTITDPAALLGYWRVMAAKTKTDWPVHIELTDGGYTATFANGAAKPVDVDDFMQGTFLRLKAVRRIEFEGALSRGEWPSDGKRAIPQSDEDRFDIIPDTPASQGGNMVIDEKTGEEVDAFWLQIKTKLAALIEKGKAIGKIDTLAKAEAAAGVRDDIRALGKLGEDKRKVEKKPFDDGADAVQAKWVPVLKPASDLAAELLTGIDAFQKAEKARLEKIERDRIAEETRQRLAREAEERRKQQEREAAERAKQAEAAGEAPPPEPEIVVPTADEIEAQAQQAAAEAPVEVAKPVVQGGAYSRATSKAKAQKGVIVDKAAFVAALLAADDPDLNACLQKRADQAARVKFKMPGVEFVDQ